MTPGAGGSLAGRAATLESDARRAAAILEKHRFLVMAALTVVYAIGAMLHGRGKPLWYDEIITVIAASAPGAAATWTAAMQVDANPPLPHLLTHFSIQWFGPSQIAARLPAIAGFWIFCFCLFRFTRRSLGIFYAFAAMLLPVATEAYTYSVEARAYGPELAFCGLSLVAWQAAAEGRRRMLNLALLAVSLAGALLCHYYAVLIFLPLAAGEAVRSRSRKIDFPVWIALAAGGAPLVWRAATIFGVMKGFTHTWARPYPEQIVEFWESGLQPAAMAAVLLIALLALALKDPEEAVDGRAGEGFPRYEIAAAVMFLALPAIAVAGALLVTHMFTGRYALPALAGFALLTPHLLARVTAGRALPGFLLFGTLLAALGATTVTFPQARDPFVQEKDLAAALEQGPVVIPDGQLFLQMWYYAPQRLKSRILFLADRELAVKYMGYDTIDDGLPVLRPWSSVQVVDHAGFHPEGGEFRAYQNTLRPGWVLSDAVNRGDQVQLLRASPARQLFRIRRAGS
jgi:hypothetical protein